MDPEPSHIRIEQDGGVAIITIDRPERFNSLDVTTAQDLRKAGLQCARDSAIRAVVLRGAGGIFCSGADLKYIHAGGDGAELNYLQPTASQAQGERNRNNQPATAQAEPFDCAQDMPVEAGVASSPTVSYGAAFKQILEYIHSTISEMKRAAKPFIAAVDGIAAAGGFGLAMACDLVFASERASFEWAYGKTGLTGAESSTFFLPRLIGLRRAMELVLLNPRLDAARALEIGLINAVYPTDRFNTAVLEVAHQLAAGPTPAYGIAKGLLNQAAGIDRLDYHLDQELDSLARIADGTDFEAGIEGFFAKRPARFSGK